MLPRLSDLRVSLLLVLIICIAGVAVPVGITAQSTVETEENITIEVQDSTGVTATENVPITIVSDDTDGGDGSPPAADRPDSLPDTVSTDAFNAVDSNGDNALLPSEIALAINENSNQGNVGGVEISPSEFALMISWNADQ